MQPNKVELIGFINWSDLKEYKSGKVAKFLLGKKIKDNDYRSFPITMFGDEGEAAYKKFKKGDRANFVGKLSMNIYEKDGVERKEIEIIAFEAKKVKFDEETKRYVEVGNELDDWE